MLDPLLLCLAAVFGLLAVDIAARSTPPAQHRLRLLAHGRGRFAGWGNLAYGQFAGAAFLLFGSCRAGSTVAASGSRSASVC